MCYFVVSAVGKNVINIYTVLENSVSEQTKHPPHTNTHAYSTYSHWVYLKTMGEYTPPSLEQLKKENSLMHKPPANTDPNKHSGKAVLKHNHLCIQQSPTPVLLKRLLLTNYHY